MPILASGRFAVVDDEKQLAVGAEYSPRRLPEKNVLCEDPVAGVKKLVESAEPNYRLIEVCFTKIDGVA